MRRGTIWSLSGLTPGAQYFMGDSGALQTAGSDLPMGVALTANALEIDKGRAA
jgi:hypothetical protein